MSGGHVNGQLFANKFTINFTDYDKSVFDPGGQRRVNAALKPKQVVTYWHWWLIKANFIQPVLIPSWSDIDDLSQPLASHLDTQCKAVHKLLRQDKTCGARAFAHRPDTIKGSPRLSATVAKGPLVHPVSEDLGWKMRWLIAQEGKLSVRGFDHDFKLKF